MNMHETYVSLELAKLLKKAGFNWEGTAYYQHGVFYPYVIDRERLIVMNQSSAPDYMEQYSAPTLDVAQRWLREVKGYHVCAQPTNSEVNKETHKRDIEYLVMIFVNINSTGGVGFVEMIESFKTHEEALEAGEKKVLELILEKKGE